MRLVDADELWKQMSELHEKRDKEANMTGDRAVCATWNDAVTLLKNAPTIDAKPVVRCRDCKFYSEDEKWCRRLGLCGAFNENDFCSHGEREDEAD